MPNIFDYLAWRGDLSLEQSPFNPVDNIILTHLSYLPLDRIVPGPGNENRKPFFRWKQTDNTVTIAGAAEIFAAFMETGCIENQLMFREDPAFIEALGSSRRYGGMKLAAFVNQFDPVAEKQFAALTILTGDRHAFITYRGTDDTLVGWKEDFKLSFIDEIPAQREAVEYLKKTARRFIMPLRLGGHSKGGNLAVYAASFCPDRIRKRITEIYTNDAPGFSARVISSKGYQAIKNKIFSFVPESSIVGMLFEHDESYRVVRSSKSGIFQHDVYTWEVMGNDLVRLDKVDQGSRFIDHTVREWLAGLDKNQRRDFTEALFTILGSTEARSFPELGAGWLKNTMTMIQSITTIDAHSRDMVLKSLAALFQAAKNNIHTLLPPAPPRKEKKRKKQEKKTPNLRQGTGPIHRDNG